MDDMTDTLLGLFTEVAILEHLVRSREEKHAAGAHTMGDFGVLNYFMTNHPSPDSISAIAWCFQEEEPYTRAKIEAMAARDLVTLTSDTGDNDKAMVMITDIGREAHVSWRKPRLISGWRSPKSRARIWKPRSARCAIFA